MPKPSNSRRRSTDLIKSDTRPINEARIICNQFSRQEGSCTARDRQLRSVHHHHHRLSTPRIRSDKIGSPIRNSKLVLISGPSRPMSGLRLREAKNQRIGSSCDVKQHVFFDGRVPTWAPFNGSRFDSTLHPSLRASKVPPLSNRFQHGGTPLDEESRTLFTPFFFFVSNTLPFVCRDLEKNICCFCNRKVYVFEGKIFEIIGTGGEDIDQDYEISCYVTGRRRAAPPPPPYGLRHCACTTALAKVKECNWDS